MIRFLILALAGVLLAALRAAGRLLSHAGVWRGRGGPGRAR